jgi:AraC family transcriptional regulator of adaptative response/methylated-DNA-[protein]-cysteine methyltransferase
MNQPTGPVADGLTPEIMYDALVRRDSQFEGSFFAAVRTTGIFCRPGCTARSPRFENVEFFRTSKEALLHGYRPCKICAPLENKDEAPVFIKELLQQLRDEPDRKIRDWELRERGMEPVQVRRWFKRHHQLTFHAFQRMLRINQAFGRIRFGETVTSAAFGNGYGSLSGFAHSFRKATGLNPEEGARNEVISITRITTPIGPMLAGCTDRGICLLEFADRKMLETEIAQLKKYFNASALPGDHLLFEALNRELQEYFEGKRTSFSVPLDTPGTAFQLAVWQALMTIPFGTTRSYKDQALSIGRPLSVRAVGHANGCNRVSILIPCHRVVGENGHLTGYGGGIWRKKWLLEHEKTLK